MNYWGQTEDSFFDFPNPIPATVKDTEDITAFFQQYGVIPYYGTLENTGQKMLDLLLTLCKMSPTFRATMRDLSYFSFGLNIDVQSKTFPGLLLDPIEVSENDKLQFAQYLSGINISPMDILKNARRIFYHLAICGNAWLRVKKVRSGGTTMYFFSVPHFMHTAYLLSYDRGEDFAIVSKFLGDLQLMQKYPPAILRVTKMGEALKWIKTDPGVEEALIHIAPGMQMDRSDYYAQPEIISVLTWLYVDFQMGNLSGKTAASEIVSKKLLAFQAPDPNTLPQNNLLVKNESEEIGASGDIGKKQKGSMFQQNMMILKELVTNLGSHPSKLYGMKSASVAGIQYPYGGHPPVSIDIEMNRDTQYHNFQLEKAASFICGILGWAPELIGIRQAKATLGGNLLYDMFTIRDTATIQPTQVLFENLFNSVIGQIVEKEPGGTRWTGYGVKFPGVIEQMLAKFQSAGGNTRDADLSTAREQTQIQEDEDGLNDT